MICKTVCNRCLQSVIQSLSIRRLAPCSVCLSSFSSPFLSPLPSTYWQSLSFHSILAHQSSISCHFHHFHSSFALPFPCVSVSSSFYFPRQLVWIQTRATTICQCRSTRLEPAIFSFLLGLMKDLVRWRYAAFQAEFTLWRPSKCIEHMLLLIWRRHLRCKSNLHKASVSSMLPCSGRGLSNHRKF